MGILDSGRKGFGMFLPYDKETGGGYGVAKLNPEHPCYRAWVRHDQVYDEILAKTATKTLKEYDDEALRNSIKLINEAVFLGKVRKEDAEWLKSEAFTHYSFMRFWAKYVRPELNDYKPAKNDGKK